MVVLKREMEMFELFKRFRQRFDIAAGRQACRAGGALACNKTCHVEHAIRYMQDLGAVGSVQQSAVLIDLIDHIYHSLLLYVGNTYVCRYLRLESQRIAK